MIKQGYLADLLLVDGDPAADVRILQDKTRILAIMKDGEFHKAPRMNRAAPAADRMSSYGRKSGSGADGAPALDRRLGCLPPRSLLWMLFGVWPDWLDWLLDGKKTFVSAMFNGVTLAGLYFLVASGFTLVFGLMRNVNLAHGSLYLLGAYIGYDVAHLDRQLVSGRDRWRARALPIIGALLQVLIFQRLTGDELRQTLVTIGISIVAADLMLAVWGGKTYQFSIPPWLDGAVATADHHGDARRTGRS